MSATESEPLPLFSHVASALRYRSFILSAINSEFKGRFQRSRIGAAWYILNPLAMAAIYAVVLSQVLGARLGIDDVPNAYPVYLIAGIACWGLFSEIANRCLSVFIEYSSALKKIAFPRIALPLVVLGGALINHAFLLLAAAIVFAFMGFFPSIHWLALPLLIFLTASFALGLGVTLGVLNVFTRDVGQLMNVVLQLWFWMTPIVYPSSIVPEGFARFMEFNPVAPLVQGYQDVFLRGQWPDLTALVYPCSLSVGLMIVSLFLFRRASSELVDAL